MEVLLLIKHWYSGFKNSETHTKYNACRVLNEDLRFSSEYSIVPFHPYNPYIKNIELAYIPLKTMLYLLLKNR